MGNLEICTKLTYFNSFGFFIYSSSSSSGSSSSGGSSIVTSKLLMAIIILLSDSGSNDGLKPRTGPTFLISRVGSNKISEINHSGLKALAGSKFIKFY